VLISPPAVGGIAWYIIAGGRMDTTGYLLLGILFVMLFIQVLFFSEYRTLTFSPNFWAFTFPVAASANFVIRWIDSARFPLWQTWTWLLAGIATAFVAALATATIVTGLKHRAGLER
jgi:tellurite resistance protein